MLPPSPVMPGAGRPGSTQSIAEAAFAPNQCTAPTAPAHWMKSAVPMLLPPTVAPVSATIRSCSSGCRSVRISAIREMIRPRSAGLSQGQGPSSKARRAAATARCISVPVESGTLPITSSVAGSRTVIRPSPSDEVCCPSM
jgi:hypothetical protein